MPIQAWSYEQFGKWMNADESPGDKENELWFLNKTKLGYETV
jgi:hypothetical protein